MQTNGYGRTWPGHLHDGGRQCPPGRDRPVKSGDDVGGSVSSKHVPNYMSCSQHTADNRRRVGRLPRPCQTQNARYHAFIQAGVVAQALLQYLAVVAPKLVWDSFGSWSRTIRPGIPPSELVVAKALRQALPEFLMGPAKTDFLHEIHRRSPRPANVRFSAWHREEKEGLLRVQVLPTKFQNQGASWESWGTVLIPGGSATKLVRREDLARMKKAVVLVDVSIDQGGRVQHRPTGAEGFT